MQFIAALEREGITVRDWSIPPYRFSKRKTMKHTQKTDRGWTNPSDKSGDLKITAADRWQAFDTVLELADEHGVRINNGAMISGE